MRSFLFIPCDETAAKTFYFAACFSLYVDKLSREQGAFLLKLARRAVRHYLETGEKLALGKKELAKLGKELEKNFGEAREKMLGKRGVFVTIEAFPGKELRGCIGFPYPVMPLGKAVVEAALSAAFGDPRFAPLQKNELEKIVFEMSVLSLPKELKVPAREREKHVEVGRDGLTIEKGRNDGLLLPQVAEEYKWTASEFLKHVCFKAGLGGGEWMDETAKVCTFQAQIFSEEAPGGKVVEHKTV